MRSVLAGLLLNGIQASDVYVCGADSGFAKRFADQPQQTKYNVNGIDGKYTKTSDTVWKNSDGSRVIVDLGYYGMEGCYATNGVANSDCYPFNRWGKIARSLISAESNIYHWDGYYFGSIQYTQCGVGMYIK